MMTADPHVLCQLPRRSPDFLPEAMELSTFGAKGLSTYNTAHNGKKSAVWIKTLLPG